MFTDVSIIWMDILPRLVWAPGSPEDRKRRRLNRFGLEMARKINRMDLGAILVDIDDTTSGFFRVDGIHLSQLGLEMLLWLLREKTADFLK
ncbi:hypothetical protein DPMN_090834 [Dreissena polymorpha]|uniref:SGNH hydrolase-type esterase domain-containing protein n=1 Tax=Dreissena polymorpha TaxID=45954 RepID=A0A9D4KZD8_DREPO|nr:hypothetical protein DPMN_090834 [Dreissena polymorpha]